MKLFGRQQGKAFTQIEPRLRAKNRERSSAGAIAALFSVIQDEAQEIVILLHIKRYRKWHRLPADVFLLQRPFMTAGESRWAAKIVGGLRPLQQCVCSRQTLVEPPGLRVLAHLFFQLILALVQGLQTQFPAMELNAQLVDVAGYFRPLRFILLQFPLQVGEFLRRRRADGH